MKWLPKDIYTITLAVANSYFVLIKRRDNYETDGAQTSIYRNEQKIHAVEQAWAVCIDDCEREIIKKNLFERIPIKYINLPMSQSAMKRARRRFLIRLAKNLAEIK